MVVVWTTAGIRYRFRIATAPLPLYPLTFVFIASVGVLTLLTDLWRAEGWLVPRGHLLTPAIWQAFLGAIFLLTFLTWAWFAYMKPPKFGKRNAKRFASFLYWKIIDGSATDMATIGQELIRSIPTLIKHAPDSRPIGQLSWQDEQYELNPVEAYADDILLLMADQRFCRTLVESSPGTILEVFQEVGETGKYGVSVSQFGRNVVSAAIKNPNSFMYHEVAEYTSGLLGILKPLSQAIFGNYRMAEVIGSLLDPHYRDMRQWSSVEWEAYNRAVLLTLKSYVQGKFWSHSFILTGALHSIEGATSELFKIDGLEDSGWDHDAVQKLKSSVDFCRKSIDILDDYGDLKKVHLRIRESDPHYYKSFIDDLVDLMFDVILAASSVKRPRSLSWYIQHNSVWGEFFGRLHNTGKFGQVVKFKLRRKIYDEIVTASEWPNYKNVRILAFCLNVMGLEISEADYCRDSRPLHKALLAWTKRNFASLEENSPLVFEHCFPERLDYDKENCRLVITYEVNALRGKPKHIYFNLDRR